MESERADMKKKSDLKHKKRKPMIIAAMCIVIIGTIAVTYFLRARSATVQSTVLQRTSTVAKGDLSISVSGSGPIASSNQVDLTSSVSGKIKKAYFKEGDNVKAGDLLFEIDDSDAILNIKQIENSIAQTQLSASSSTNNIDNLTIKAPISGQLTNIADLNTGDEIMKGATLATITDKSKLKLKVSFSSTAIQEIKEGQKAVVNIQDFMQSVDGKVSSISNVASTTSSGGKVQTVEITIDNPGSLKDGMAASVEIDTGNGPQMSMDEGELEYINSQVVISKSNGTIESINMNENQQVNSGDILVQLQNDDLYISSQTNDLKIEDLNAQLESAEKQLQDYKIYAPIDGVIVSQSVKEDNTVKPGDALVTVTDAEHMEFDISTDELDISKIKIGQKANITVDALTETSANPLSGEVVKIAIEGTSTNGVTTYPVTVKINGTANLKIGMNANAEILTNEKNSILMIPLEAVQTMKNKSFVWVKSADSANKSGNVNFSSGKQNNQNTTKKDNSGNPDTSDQNVSRMPRGTAGRNSALSSYYSGAVLTPIETGINNDEYIEVISGLKEGDQVVLPQLADSINNTQQNNLQMRGFGGAGGEMGGFPGSNDKSSQRAIQQNFKN